MITDQQYREALIRIEELEKKVNALSRSMTEILMKSDTRQDTLIHTESEKRKDITRFSFQGVNYCKRQLVLAVIKKYIKDFNITDSSGILAVFPDYTQGSLGVIRRAEEAELYDGAKARYFFNDEDILHFSDGLFVVCKDWSTNNINRFLQIAEKIGYEIKPIIRN